MRIYKKSVLLIVMLLLFAFCQTAYAEDDSVSDIEIFVCETTTVFDASGEEIGQLSQNESEECVFHQSSEDGTENVARVFLQRSIANQNADGAQADLAGKCEIKIVWEANESAKNTENSETSSDASAGQNGNSEIVVTGWIDSDTVIDALIQTDTDRSEEVVLLEGEIGALQANVDRLTTELQEKDAKAEAAENKLEIADVDKESAVDVLGIIGLAMLTLIISWLVWFTIKWKANDIPNEQDESSKKEEDAKAPVTINQTITIRLEASEDVAKNGMKFLRNQTASNQNDDEQNQQPKNFVEDSKNDDNGKKNKEQEEPKESPEEEIEQRALDLANRLSAIKAPNEWHDEMKSKGFQVILLKESKENNPSLVETKENSALAAINHAERKEVLYMIPSYRDSSAYDVPWTEYYDIEQEPNDKKGYLIKELTELSRNENCFVVTKKGKMILYIRKED